MLEFSLAPNHNQIQDHKRSKDRRGASQGGDNPTRHTLGCSAYGADSRPTRPPDKRNRCDVGKNDGGVVKDQIDRVVKAPVRPPRSHSRRILLAG